MRAAAFEASAVTRALVAFVATFVLALREALTEP